MAQAVWDYQWVWSVLLHPRQRASFALAISGNASRAILGGAAAILTLGLVTFGAGDNFFVGAPVAVVVCWTVFDPWHNNRRDPARLIEVMPWLGRLDTVALGVSIASVTLYVALFYGLQQTNTISGVYRRRFVLLSFCWAVATMPTVEPVKVAMEYYGLGLLWFWKPAAGVRERLRRWWLDVSQTGTKKFARRSQGRG